MAAHRKYSKRYCTQVAMEQVEKDLCEALGIEHPDAHRIGLHVLIEQRINDGDRRVTPEVIEKFADLKKTLYRDFQAYIRLQDAAQVTLQNIKTTVEEREELIEVYDRGEETYTRITRAELDRHPEWYVLPNGSVPA